LLKLGVTVEHFTFIQTTSVHSLPGKLQGPGSWEESASEASPHQIMGLNERYKLSKRVRGGTLAILRFLQRCMECRRGLAMRISSDRPSVRPSVRLSVRQTREL